MHVFITPLSRRLQNGTRSASVEQQQQLQSAAHTFYQQVVCVLKQRALVERERPGLFLSLVFNDMVMLPFQPVYATFVLTYILSIFTLLFFDRLHYFSWICN